jgi:uncharacterized surface protein with fasciclin (FAS1) repeats
VWDTPNVQDNTIMKRIILSLAVVAAIAATSIAKAPTKDIVDTAVGAGQFKTLASLLGKAGLVDTLKGTGPFTVFAPTDAAFAKLPADLVKKVTNDKKLLTTILTYHVVAGRVLAKDVVKLKSAKTVQGEAVSIKVRGGKVSLNGATKVVATDVLATNGVIHVIDTVLLPPSVAKAIKGAKSHHASNGAINVETKSCGDCK